MDGRVAAAAPNPNLGVMKLLPRWATSALRAGYLRADRRPHLRDYFKGLVRPETSEVVPKHLASSEEARQDVNSAA